MMEFLIRLNRWLQRLLLKALSLFWRPVPAGPVTRIAVLELTRLGDLISATALFAPLKAAFPSASLELWGPKALAPLFEGDSRLTYFALPPRGLDFLKTAWAARGALRGGDLLLVSASPAVRHSILALLSKPGRAAGYLFQRPGGLGYDEAQPASAFGFGGQAHPLLSGKEDHLVERARKVLRVAGLGEAGADPLMPGGGKKEKVALLHAGANWKWRRWPLERFEALRKLLEAEGWQVQLMAAEADPSQVLLRIGDLKKLLGIASLFVGNDSGPLHLAASMGVPCLGLYGPNDPARSGPWGTVHRTVYEKLWCSPCAQDHCVQPHGWCMARIEVARVFEEIQRMEIKA